MRVWTAFYCVAIAVEAGETLGCDMSIDGDTYRKENLVTNIDLSLGLAVDYNKLYFSYSKNEIWFNAKADLRTGEINRIEELSGACVFEVDRVHDEVHAGCVGDREGRGGGLYQFDSHPGKFVLAGEAGRRVRFVYYNTMLYYSFYPWLFLHIFRRGHSIRVQDLPSQVRGLVIDKRKDWIFHNDTGVYRQQAGQTVAVTRYAGLDLTQLLAIDTSGTVYASDWGRNPGIYRLHERTPTATKLLDIKACNGLTLDRDDNIIYSNGTRIIRLVKC